METYEVSIPSLVKGLDVIRKKRKVCKKTIDENLDNMISVLENKAMEIENIGDPDENEERVNTKVKDLVDNVLKMKILDQIVVNHKKFYIHLSKVTKCSEKVFNKGVNELFPHKEIDRKLLNKTIYQHFLYNKNMNITENLKNETGFSLDLEVEIKLLEFHNIYEDLTKQNLDTAISWAKQNKEELEKINSDLLFLLYQQKFVQLRNSADKQNCVLFARDAFSEFFPKYTSSIEKLMGSLICEKVLENPRYSDLYDVARWNDVSKLFFKQACTINNITPQSALKTILEAGTIALPHFLKFFSLSSENEWEIDKELPIAIDIGNKYTFHSTIICPITKEKCTSENLPIALSCGHVISSAAFHKIFGPKKQKYKCPYCPTEISIASSKVLYLD